MERPETTHDEQDAWEREHALWLQDLRRWEHEQQAVMRKVSQLERLLVRHALECEEHARAIRTHTELLSDEELLSEGGEDPDAPPGWYDALRQRHRELGCHHDDQRRVHERLCERQQQMIARMNELLQTLGDALSRRSA